MTLWGGGHGWRGGPRDIGFMWWRLASGTLSQHLPNVRLVQCTGPHLERKQVQKGRAAGQWGDLGVPGAQNSWRYTPSWAEHTRSIVTNGIRKGSCPTDSLPTNRASTSEPRAEGLPS